MLQADRQGSADGVEEQEAAHADGRSHAPGTTAHDGHPRGRVGRQAGTSSIARSAEHPQEPLVLPVLVWR